MGAGQHEIPTVFAIASDSMATKGGSGKGKRMKSYQCSILRASQELLRADARRPDLRSFGIRPFGWHKGIETILSHISEDGTTCQVHRRSGDCYSTCFQGRDLRVKRIGAQGIVVESEIRECGEAGQG